MPLVTAIERDGKNLPLDWDYFHLSCMLTAAFKEALPNEPISYKAPDHCYKDLEDGEWVDFSMSPIYYLEVKPPVLSEGRQVLKSDHRFDGIFQDGEEMVFELKAGDVLKAHREHRR